MVLSNLLSYLSAVRSAFPRNGSGLPSWVLEWRINAVNPKWIYNMTRNNFLTEFVHFHLKSYKWSSPYIKLLSKPRKITTHWIRESVKLYNKCGRTWDTPGKHFQVSFRLHLEFPEREGLGIEERESVLPSRGVDGGFHLVTLGLILLCYVLSGLYAAF